MALTKKDLEQIDNLLTNKLDQQYANFEKLLDEKLDAQTRDIAGVVAGAIENLGQKTDKVDNHEKRITDLESTVFASGK